mmetsp:Transcript_2149/g.4877  ORF Transcript_2149/g.4877 Transcript_2149/m.4877 type:complete len:1017 (+) Transcript_2149:127-3177(+)
MAGATGWLRGVVKEVNSGDQVTVVSSGSAGHAQIAPGERHLRPEKRFFLSGIAAPRLGRRDGKTEDEPYAWASREALRRKLVGKPCVFKIDRVQEQEGRAPLEFGSLFVNDSENAALAQVSAGLARAKGFGGKGGDGDQDPFRQAEEGAKERGKGLWAFSSGGKSAKDASANGAPAGKKKRRGGGAKKKAAAAAAAAGLVPVRKARLPRQRKVVQVGGDGGEESAQDLMQAWQARNVAWVPAVVESVGNPHVLRVAIPDPPAAADPLVANANGGTGVGAKKEEEDAEPMGCRLATVFLAGVGCPLVSKRDSPGVVEPFAVRAKVFVENLVLNQDVQIKFEGQDKFGNLYCSVQREVSGVVVNVAEGLLKEGLARIADWSSRMLAPMAASRLRQAEKGAKAQKAGVWHDYVAPAAGEGFDSDGVGGVFKAVVTEVVSGDTLVVWVQKERSERRVQLSSIRAPRLPSRANNNQGDPWAQEAKEVLRQKTIGKEVTVKMDYTRKVPVGGAAAKEGGGEGQQQQQTRTLSFATVLLGEQNLAGLLLARGLASTVKHRSDDDTSACYEDLVEAETKAQKARKGLHSGKTPSPPGRVNDLGTNGSLAKSKQFLPFLQRSDRVHAVVDYVLSGHRFRMSIPKDSLSVTFALSEVRCPGRGDPFSDEALKYARLHCTQRDVEIEVFDIDRAGTFTGRLHLPQQTHHGKRVDFSQSLAAAGLAKVSGYGVPAGSPLVAAQNRAKAQRVGLWQDWEEPTAEDLAAAAAAQAGADSAEKVREVETLKMRAVNVVSGGLFYAQRADDQTASLLQEIGALSLGGSDGSNNAGSFRSGEVVLCRYAGDGQVYRARVESYDATSKMYTVFYLDFGNRAQCPAKDLGVLSMGMQSSAPLAFACRLAHVKAPGLEEDYGYEAAEFLQELVGRGQTLCAAVEERVSETLAGSRKPETVLRVRVTDPATNDDVAIEMVRNGLARVERQGRFAKASEAVKALRQEEEVARKDHLHIWQYGDCGSDEEDGPAWGSRR